MYSVELNRIILDLFVLIGVNNKRLPLLIPVNPTNYGKVGVLSSVEALSAALFISGFNDLSLKILNIFKWR